MSLWVIIPVKPLNRAKSRLADVLTPEQRYDFASKMLEHTLEVVTQVPQVTGALVISRDTKALAMARDAGAKSVQESSPSDLNPALTRATEVIRVWGGDSILILPADLPFLSADDVINMIQLSTMGDSIVIATDREQDGTNGLLVRPAGLLNYSYGQGSYDRHLEAAKLVGAKIHYYESENMLLDIDVPADLEAFNQRVAEYPNSPYPPFLLDATLN